MVESVSKKNTSRNAVISRRMASYQAETYVQLYNTVDYNLREVAALCTYFNENDPEQTYVTGEDLFRVLDLFINNVAQVPPIVALSEDAATLKRQQTNSHAATVNAGGQPVDTGGAEQENHAHQIWQPQQSLQSLPSQQQILTDWRLRKVQAALLDCNTPMLNLSFFNPLIRNTLESAFNYQLIFSSYHQLQNGRGQGESKNQQADQVTFLQLVRKRINQMKQVLFSGESQYSKAQQDETLRQVMPLMHFLIYIFTYMPLIDPESELQQLASSVDELRMLPLPHGMLANELITVIDQERLMPGLT